MYFVFTCEFPLRPQRIGIITGLVLDVTNVLVRGQSLKEFTALIIMTNALIPTELSKRRGSPFPPPTLFLLKSKSNWQLEENQVKGPILKKEAKVMFQYQGNSVAQHEELAAQCIPGRRFLQTALKVGHKLSLKINILREIKVGFFEFGLHSCSLNMFKKCQCDILVEYRSPGKLWAAVLSVKNRLASLFSVNRVSAVAIFPSFIFVRKLKNHMHCCWKAYIPLG